MPRLPIALTKNFMQGMHCAVRCTRQAFFKFMHMHACMRSGHLICICTCMHAAYIDTNGSKDCVAFTVKIDATGAATCILKPKAIANGEQCPDGSTCISGQL